MDIFQNIFTRIDDTVINNLANGTANLASILSPAFQAVFLVYVMFIGWSYWQNASSIESTAIDLVKRIMVWGLILGFSMNIANYNSFILPLVLNFGDGLSQAFLGSETSNATGLDALASQIIDLVVANSDAAWEADGIAEKIAAVLSTTVDNAMILITSSIFFVIAAAYMVLVKVFLAILAVLGPVFLALLLFPATRQYGINWINQVLNYSLLTLLINIAGGFFIGFVNSVLSDMAASGATTGAAVVLDGVIGVTGVLQIVLATLMFVIILWKLPELASSLAGGMAANGFGQLVNAARVGKQLAGGGKGGKSGGAVKAEGKGK